MDEQQDYGNFSSPGWFMFVMMAGTLTAINLAEEEVITWLTFVIPMIWGLVAWAATSFTVGLISEIIMPHENDGRSPVTYSQKLNQLMGKNTPVSQNGLNNRSLPPNINNLLYTDRMIIGNSALLIDRHEYATVKQFFINRWNGDQNDTYTNDILPDRITKKLIEKGYVTVTKTHSTNNNQTPYNIYSLTDSGKKYFLVDKQLA